MNGAKKYCHIKNLKSLLQMMKKDTHKRCPQFIQGFLCNFATMISAFTIKILPPHLKLMHTITILEQKQSLKIK